MPYAGVSFGFDSTSGTHLLVDVNAQMFSPFPPLNAAANSPAKLSSEANYVRLRELSARRARADFTVGGIGIAVLWGWD
jgi:hypothetical protein